MDQLKIGKFISELRKENNLTQQVLGEKLGVTNKTISRWENGVYMPDIEMLQLIGKEFEVTVNELINGERVSKDEFKVKISENLIYSDKRESIFLLKDKIHFFKIKWIKEHIAIISLSIILLSFIFVVALLKKSTFIIGGMPILGIISYVFIYNRMMIYVENKAFN